MRVLFSFLLVTVSLTRFCGAAETASVDNTVLKWKDGKKAVFMLAFDDSAPSQLKNVIPELEKHKLVGTFYLVTGNSLYNNLRLKWEAASKSPSVELANHSFTHTGATDVEKLNTEMEKCNEVLYKMDPDRKQPRLIAFGKPGGVPWTVSKEDFNAALTKYHLIDRPPFYGPPMHYKSAAEMIAAVDAAIKKGDMGHMDFHGVGGDWLITPVEWFTALTEKLDASKDVLWVTDTISWHKYLTERQSAEIKVLHSDKTGLTLELSSKADPAFYDYPLTLSSKVPADWKSCVVEQGTVKTTVEAKDGAIQYAAIPGGGEIKIHPATQ